MSRKVTCLNRQVVVVCLCMWVVHFEDASSCFTSIIKVNVCFLLDCTGSMLSWITQIKDNIVTWKMHLLDSYSNAQLRFAFVRYTDFDQPEDTRTSFLDFTE